MELATYVAAAPSHDGKLRIYSEDRQELLDWNVRDLAHIDPTGHWSDYVIGVAQQLLRAGFEIEPVNLLIRSTVPDGAGLSSSAALQVSAALAFLDGRALAPLELARLCLNAESEFVGLPCGIMDQYISVFGREHVALEIDCRSLEHRPVQLPQDITFVAVDSMVKHALESSAYKDRVRECMSAAHRLGVASLRDASLPQLAELPDIEMRRARHVVTENDRVVEFVAAGAGRNLEKMGALLVQSHRSLQLDYEVSCAELDFLVDAALAIDGVYGARMTGGGFGGCIVSMVRTGAVSEFIAAITRAYEQEFQITPNTYECKPAAAAREIAPA